MSKNITPLCKNTMDNNLSKNITPLCKNTLDSSFLKESITVIENTPLSILKDKNITNSDSLIIQKQITKDIIENKPSLSKTELSVGNSNKVEKDNVINEKIDIKNDIKQNNIIGKLKNVDFSKLYYVLKPNIQNNTPFFYMVILTFLMSSLFLIYNNLYLCTYIFGIFVPSLCIALILQGLLYYTGCGITKSQRPKFLIPNKFKKSFISRAYSSSKVKFKKEIKTCLNEKKESNAVITKIKRTTGLEPYIFDIFYGETKIKYELDTGASNSIIQIDYLKSKIPEYEQYFLKHPSYPIKSVTGHAIENKGLYRIPFTVPNYGKLVLDLLVVTNTIPYCFLLGREFIKKTNLTMIYDNNNKGVKLAFNKNPTPKIKVNDHLSFERFESKSIVGKIINNKRNTCYKIKNSSHSPLYFEQIKRDKNDVYLKVTNISDKPLNHKISYITLMEEVIKLDKNNNIFDFEKLLCHPYINRYLSFLTFLYTQFWIAFINIKLTIDDITQVIPDFIIQFLKNNFYARWLLRKLKGFDYNSTIDSKEISYIQKNLSTSDNNSIDENEFFESFQKDTNIGLKIEDIIQSKLLTVNEIKSKLSCQFEHVKDRISNLLYELQIYSKHTFDCGTLNENLIPKMSIRLNSPIFKNTKPYNLKEEDRKAVDKFFDLLLEHGYASVAPPSQSFGNPVFTVPSRSDDGSNMPRIIIDAKFSNEAVSGGSTASLPDYKNLLGPIVQKARYITTIDLKKCFYSILVDEQSKLSGAMNVLTERGAFVMHRALTGFCQTPSYLTQTFQKYLHLDEKGQIDFIQNLLIFMDDLILYSESNETLEEHLNNVEKLLKRLHLIGVKISPSKCTIACDLNSQEEIHILGYKIKNRNISCPDKKINEINNLGEPDSLKKLQSLLGKINYYRSIFPLPIHEQCNILYKKLNPFTYDDEAKKAFFKIKELLSNTERNINVCHENSINVLLTDASHYSIGSVLLNVDMSECVKTFPIQSFPFTFEINHPYPSETEYVYLCDNLIECIIKSAKKLNYKRFSEDLSACLNLIFTTCNLYEQEFIEFLPYSNNKKEYLNNIHNELFSKNITDLNNDYLLTNTFIFNYILFGMSKILNATLIISSECGTITIGNYKEQICFMIHDNITYGLNIKKPYNNLSKTLMRFGPNLITLNEFKTYFIKMIKENTYDTNKHLINIVGFYSKAMKLGCIQKTGIACLEIFSVYKSLQHFEPYITNRVTYLLLDSMVVKSLLTKHKPNTRSTKIDNLANSLYFWYKGTALFFIHVSDHQNLADVWSRLCPIELSTLNNEVKPFYQDDYLTISKYKILQDDVIKSIPSVSTSKNYQGFSKYPHIGKYFVNKFKQFFSTHEFIKLQLKEKNVPDMLPHTVKYLQNKIILPQVLYLPFISFIHFSLMHIGVQRLWNYVNNYYYFNNKKLAKMICDNLTSSCVYCIKNKPNTLRLKEGFTFDNSIKSPNTLIYSDLLEFPIFEGQVRKSNPKALLIIKDVFSKYTTIYILQTKTSQAIINCLANYFSVHDICTSFISDNASIYKSKTITTYFKNLNVKVLNSSILKSKSRGFIERAVRTTNELIRFYRTNYTSLDISHILSITSNMLNKIPFYKEKLSPYNIHFQSTAGLMDGDYLDPTDNIFEYKFNKEFGSYSPEYRQELEKMIIDCDKRVKNYKLNNSLKRNKNRIFHNLYINDIVVIKTNDKGYESKYRPIFGLIPYKIVRSNKYTLTLENQFSKQTVYRHVSDVKKIDFEKLSKLEIEDFLANSLSLLTLSNLDTMFEIPIAIPRKLRNKIQIEQNNESSSSSDDDDTPLNTKINDTALPPVIEVEEIDE